LEPRRPGKKRRRRAGVASRLSWAFDDKVVKPYTPGKEFFATDAIYRLEPIGWLDEKKIQKIHSFCFCLIMHPTGLCMLTRRIFQSMMEFMRNGYESIRKARYKRQLEMGCLKKTPHLE